MTVPNATQRVASSLLGVLATSALLVMGGHGDVWAMCWLGYAPVGAVILWKRPGNRIGWLCLAFGCGIALSDVVQHAFAAPRGPGAVLGLQLGNALAPLSFLLLVALVAVFPTGAPYGAPSRTVLRFVVVMVPVVVLATFIDPGVPAGASSPGPLAVPAVGPVTGPLLGIGFLLVPLCMALAGIDVFRRWRASVGAERQQLRWFVAALVMLVVALAGIIAANTSTAVPPLWQGVVLVAACATVPVSIGVAVTRYGLYDLDRVVSRTVSYAVVTASVVAVYALVVASASALLPEGVPSWVVAAATLAAAALVRPLLSRVQRLVDRRFNRERVDAQREITAFGQALVDQSDPTSASARLMAVTSSVFSPSSTALWMSGSRS